MRITVEISDVLLTRARRHARKVGRPLRALIEDGLRHVLEVQPARSKYRLPDLSVGNPGGPNPLEKWSRQDLRDEIHGGR